MGQPSSKPAEPTPCAVVFNTSQDAINAALIGSKKLLEIATPVACFDKEDTGKWSSLETDRKNVIKNVLMWARAAKKGFEMARQRLKSNPNETMMRAFEGFGTPDQTLDQLTTFAQSVQDCSNAHKSFQNDCQQKYGDQLTRNKAWRGFLGAVSGLGFVAGIVLLVLHFVPGVAFVLVPAELAAVGIGLVAAGLLGIAALSKTEIERAIDYLQNTQKRLGAVRNAIAVLNQDVTGVKGARPAEYDKEIGNCVRSLEALISTCEAA